MKLPPGEKTDFSRLSSQTAGSRKADRRNQEGLPRRHLKEHGRVLLTEQVRDRLKDLTSPFRRKDRERVPKKLYLTVFTEEGE